MADNASRVRGAWPPRTMTPEFGPDGYLHTTPFTGVPVADLDQINAWMGARLRRQFSAFAAARMVESDGGR